MVNLFALPCELLILNLTNPNSLPPVDRKYPFRSDLPVSADAHTNVKSLSRSRLMMSNGLSSCNVGSFHVKVHVLDLVAVLGSKQHRAFSLMPRITSVPSISSTS